MSNIGKVWGSLNGKKTLIGGILLTVGYWITQFDPTPSATVAAVLHYLELAGGLLGGVGLIHKADKSVTIIPGPKP
jgi:hypothetical protein